MRTLLAIAATFLVALAAVGLTFSASVEAPADFREVLPVSRKHLIPLLNFFDGAGVTLRDAEGRSVPAS